ncbi:RNA pyrophosphohydrolase [Sphingomonas sp.]|uniref:RNA pyrophosphohydrolase n=1 Tax=Sphingomonas sp. TaxID=28214 RepID=UPI002CC6DE76|nr:RNA pyrophosphohydrolase [Sphingomonas sp.]HTG39672.1 RNA pyrophosphohydrolase [Sphingomonas sp.]
MSAFADLPYRPCAGVMLVNRDGRVFVGQRLDSVLEAWQMPQGGIDDGEAPIDAAVRELGEEAGIAPHLVELVAQAGEELTYDLPDDLIGKVWKGKWRGQRQRWFLFRFLGEDSDVNIKTAEPEFRAWRWIEPAELPEMIVPFKRELYQRLLDIFAESLPARDGAVR